MAKIRFVREGIDFDAAEGMTVLEAEIAAGLEPDAPCGGRGKCGKCKVLTGGQVVLACQTLVEDGMEVQTEHNEEETAHILLEGSGRKVAFAPGKLPEEVERPLLAAVDVGSTSVVVYLFDGKDGHPLSVESTLNPQRQYGGDVVERGNYAMEHGGAALSGCIREAVQELLVKNCLDAGRDPSEIVKIVMVGNSCMHHLYLELPVKTLVMAPYEPYVKDAMCVKAVDYGITACPHADLYWLSNIGGFVGADTVGCILSSGIYERDELTLLVDIGTNGEMVLGNKDGLLASSTAAGPAFEGAKITCGMRGSEGAIDHVVLEDGKLKYHVIDDVEPVGICGSGLLDAVACLLKLEEISETGRLEETYHFTEDVFINQKDVRELQLAKAAICAGVRLLCKYKGVEASDITEVLIAGAFGNYLDPDSACDIGMLPEELKGKITPIGNAAGEGASMAVLNHGEYERSRGLAKWTEFKELALAPDFQEVYVDEMLFPEC